MLEFAEQIFSASFASNATKNIQHGLDERAPNTIGQIYERSRSVWLAKIQARELENRWQIRKYYFQRDMIAAIACGNAFRFIGFFAILNFADCVQEIL